MHSTVKAAFAVLSSLGLALVACQSDVVTTAGVVPSEAGAEIPPGSSEDGGTDADASAPAGECRLGKGWDRAPATTCGAAAGACVANAPTGAAVSACIKADPQCSGCFSDVVAGCLVGTPGKPGVCAPQAACVDGCVAGVCGPAPSGSCRTDALTTGACKALSDKLQSCLEKADQGPCIERFRSECLPKASCGNKVVDRGERCDGNCPTACPDPPPGDLCSSPTLKGNAATCSAFCEAQSNCPAGCPTNGVAVSTVGVIASGADLSLATKVSWPTLASLKAHGCPSVLSASSHVIAWRAPANGRYKFSATCSVTWEEFERGTGRPFIHALQCLRRVALANGKQCDPGTGAFACSLDVDNSLQQSQMADVAALAPVALDVGEELLVAVELGLRYVPPPETANTYGGHVKSSSWSVSATTCVPQCAGKTCGADGCGGSCGACGAGDTCTAAGQCLAPCVPQCAGKVCGNNGCGGSCGACAGGQTCAAGQCQAACVPQCAGKTCGSNGCGGSCGVCGAGRTCNAASSCELVGPCDPVNNVGCAAPNQCITLANESNQCVLMGAGVRGSPCANSANCKGGYACFAGTCRKICDRGSGQGCSFDEACAPVAGWFKLGTCATN